MVWKRRLALLEKRRDRQVLERRKQRINHREMEEKEFVGK